MATLVYFCCKKVKYVNLTLNLQLWLVVWVNMCNFVLLFNELNIHTMSNLIEFLAENGYNTSNSSDFEIIQMGLACCEFQSDVYRPSKPILVKNPTSAQAENFAIALKQYEEELVGWKAIEAKNKIRNMKIDTLILAYSKERSGLDALNMSDKVKNKIFSKAWSDGHSSGHVEVFHELCELVEMLTD